MEGRKLLLPCRCGGEAGLYRLGNREMYFYFTVKCTKCGYGLPPYIFSKNLSEIIKAWNEMIEEKEGE